MGDGEAMGDNGRREAEELFHRVVDLSPRERQEFLARHCRDPRVRAEVEELLACDAAGAGGDARPLPETFPVLGDMLRFMERLAKGPLLEGAKQLGDYRIVRKVGRGGMGTVYEAVQESLGRKVALKVLPDTFALDPELVERFRREARATARIHHPSIVPIYEVGEVENIHYYTMEFIEGPSLDAVIADASKQAEEAKKGCPTSNPDYIRRVLEQMASLCDGLEEAHAQGLVHRDIKPANILVQRSGRYVLADFGLVHDVRAESLTRSGQMLGTLYYMSPEQVAGRETGPQTDVYSLGVTLFELLTLEKPFAGKSAHEIQSAILNQEPPPPRRRNARLERDLETIILHCLEKQPERRYRSAGELADDLRRLLRSEPILARPQSTWEKVSRRAWRHRGKVAVALLLLAMAGVVVYLAMPARITSLAVLPFVNDGVAPEMEYLGEGLSDSLVFRLGQLPKLQVKSKSAVAVHQGKRVEPQAIGRALEVDAVLSGRVQQRDADLAITVELISTRNNETIWGERYERRPEPFDLRELEEEISAAVVAGLKVTLNEEGGKRLRKRYTRDREAFLLYHQGRHFFNSYTEDGFQKSLEYFRQAIAKDPQFALAHVGMAETYIILGTDFRSPKEMFPLALEHALEAEKLDPLLGEAHAALGSLRLYYNWDWEAARRELKRALELNPRCAESFPCYLHSLDAMSRPEEAKRQVEQALLNVDQCSLTLLAELGCTAYYGGRYAEGLECAATTLRLQEDHVLVLYNQARALGQLGRYPEAIQSLQKALSKGEANFLLAELAYVYARSNERAKAEEILGTLMERKKQGFVDPYVIACVHVGLDQPDKALESLGEALAVKSSWVPWLNVEPKFSALRRDPRFQTLLKGLHLPAA